MECVFKGRHGESKFHGVLRMRRNMACLVMAGTLGVCSGYGQVAEKDSSQKSEEPKKAVVGSELPVNEPSQKADKTTPSGVAKPAIKPAVALPDAKPVKHLTGNRIVLDEGFEGVLPDNLGDYLVEIHDLSLGKLLGIVKARPVVLKEDVGTVRVGHILLDGSALSSLVDTLPEVVEGVEIKRVNGPMGAVVVIGRANSARKNEPGGGYAPGATMGGGMAAPLSTPAQENQVIPVNLGTYLGVAKGDEKERKIKDLREMIEIAFNMKAKGDGKKSGKVEILFHGPTELGFLSGTPQDLAFAMMTLQALGIKTPAVSKLNNGTGFGQSSVANYVVPFRANPNTADPVYVETTRNGRQVFGEPAPASSGGPAYVGHMAVEEQALFIPVQGLPLHGKEGLPNLNQGLPKVAPGLPLNDQAKRIADLEAIIRGLEAELESAKKKAGK